MTLAATKVVIYPGSFDPITMGHMDIIRRAVALFGDLYVGVGVNVGKSSLFTTDERADLIHQACLECELPPGSVHINAFRGLVTDYAEQTGAVAIVRGMRTISDFEFEFQFAHVTRSIRPGLEVLFLPTTEQNSFVSSSMVKELARHGGDVTPFVPKCVADALTNRLRNA